jgi:guanylate kinase
MSKIKGKVFAVSGSSGAGKTTIVNAVLELLPNFRKVKTYTTRPMRPNEVPGQDYHFLSLEQFEVHLKEGFFIESSQAYGNYYGCSKDSIKETELGISLIYILDYQGCLALKRFYPETVGVWIDVDLNILRQRLEKRGEKKPTLERRLEIAKREKDLNKTDLFSFNVVNNDLKKAVFEIKNILEGAI